MIRYTKKNVSYTLVIIVIIKQLNIKRILYLLKNYNYLQLFNVKNNFIMIII